MGVVVLFLLYITKERDTKKRKGRLSLLKSAPNLRFTFDFAMVSLVNKGV